MPQPKEVLGTGGKLLFRTWPTPWRKCKPPSLTLKGPRKKNAIRVVVSVAARTGTLKKK